MWEVIVQQKEVQSKDEKPRIVCIKKKLNPMEV